jgi:hypothetical protein
MAGRRKRLRLNPFGTLAACAAVLLGILGLVMGEGVSEGMTNSLRGAAAPVAHLWGAMSAAGGAMKLYGLYWHRTTVEVPGLWLMSGAYAFYCVTVLVGLGRHGLAAGVIAGALAIGCVLKVRVIMGTARAVDRERGRWP